MRHLALPLLVLLVAACGGGDSGTNTPPPPPVATVQIVGAPRIKVGDQYQFSVEARTSDGTVVQRPISWTLSPGMASISNGILVATATGAINVRATVEGISASTQLTAYDWIQVADGGTSGVGIYADDVITNQFGASEHADLVIGCVDGTFVVGVSTDHFITANGIVAYGFDNGAPISATWLETEDFNGLALSGSNLSRKSFATEMSRHTQFSFAFGEYLGSIITTHFRVSGLSQFLPPLLTACPSNSLRAQVAHPSSSQTPMAELLRALRTQAH